MEPATRYREMRFYQKRGLTLRLAIPSFLKNGTLLLTAVLAYRQSTHAAAKALSLLVGGKAVMQVLSRVLVPQLLLMINEEGISYTPSTFFFELNVKLAWQEIASIYIGTASLSRASIEPHNQEVQLTLSMLFPQQPVRGTARLLCITLKDVEAFKRSRGFQNMETFKEGRNLLDIALRRVPVQAFVEKIGTPVLLEQSMLSLSLEELLERIRLHFADVLEAEEIQLLEEQPLSFADDTTPSRDPSARAP